MKRLINIIMFCSIAYYGFSLANEIPFNRIIEFMIWLVLVYHFVYRARKHKDVKRFFKSQYLDWIAMIPVFILPITPLSAFLRFVILIALTFDYLLSFIEQVLLLKPLVMVFVLYVVILITGAIGFVQFESMQFGEAMWLAFISSTTVGYGDVSAVTVYGHLVSVYVIIAGTIIFGAVLISVVMLLIEGRRNTMIKEAEEEENIFEDIEFVRTSFDKFKSGEMTITQLENIVYTEIQKKDNEIEE